MRSAGGNSVTGYASLGVFSKTEACRLGVHALFGEFSDAVFEAL